MQGGSENSCVVCGAKYRLADFVEVTDYAIGKKYPFAIVTCECGRILNDAELRKILPEMVYNVVFFN
jgi:hypothetical protein